MKDSDIRLSAEKLMDKVDKINKLTQMEGWKVLIEFLDQLMAQEMSALRGQKLDDLYYKRIGFLQYLLAIREIPGVLKDKSVQQYLLHQGRSKAIEVVKNIPGIFNKQRQVALKQIEEVMKNIDAEAGKKTFTEEVYQKG